MGTMTAPFTAAAAAVWTKGAALPRLRPPLIPCCSHTASKHRRRRRTTPPWARRRPPRPQTSCLTPIHSSTCTLLYSTMPWPRLYPRWRTPMQPIAVRRSSPHSLRRHLLPRWVIYLIWRNLQWRMMKSSWKRKLYNCVKAILACTRSWRARSTRRSIWWRFRDQELNSWRVHFDSNSSNSSRCASTQHRTSTTPSCTRRLRRPFTTHLCPPHPHTRISYFQHMKTNRHTHLPPRCPRNGSLLTINTPS